MSRGDQNRGDDGVREFFWEKDLKIRFREDEIGEDHVLVMTDVDYYVDLADYLGKGRPVLMYTVVPTEVENRAEDYYYRVCAGDKIEYHVAGGGRYSHQLWNYDLDSVTVYKTYRSGFKRFATAFLGLLAYVIDFRMIVTYDVEQLQLGADPNHRIVMLTPSFELPAFFWRTFNALERRKYCIGKVATLYDAVSGQMSLGLDGYPGCVTLDAATLSGLILRLKSKTTSFTVGDIEVFIGTKVKDIRVAASLLYGILSETMDLSFSPNVVKTSVVPVNFRPVASHPLEEEKKKGMVCTSPLVTNPALIPAGCRDTAEVAVRERVTKVANDKVPKSWVLAYAMDFVKALVPDHLVGKGVPLTLDEIIAQQDTPVRKARVKTAELRIGAFCLNSLKTFIKTEPYTNLNDPRVITTCSTESLLELSQFAKAFKRDILCDKSWYGPGLDPEETVARLGEVCPDNHSIERDFSRMDGRNSKWVLDNLVTPVYMRWCCPDEKPRLKHAISQVYRSRAVSSGGFSYDAGYGTRSGSAITTDVNTIPNCFVSYASLRSLGFDHTEAWARLGLYYGDDSVDSYVDGFVEASKKVTDELGMIADCEVSPPEDPVTFLSRRFINPSRIRTSYCNVNRALPKLHLTTQSEKTVTRALAATNKAHGYAVTDARTPLVGDWAQKVLELTGITPKNLTRDQIVRASKAWPQDPEDDDALLDCVSKDLGMTTAEIIERRVAINAATDLDSFPVVWSNPFPVKCEALVAGELRTPPAASIDEESTKSVPKKCRPKRANPAVNQRTSPESSRPCTSASARSRSNKEPSSQLAPSQSSARSTRRRARQPRSSQDSAPQSSPAQPKVRTPPASRASSPTPKPVKGKKTPGIKTKQEMSAPVQQKEKKDPPSTPSGPGKSRGRRKARSKSATTQQAGPSSSVQSAGQTPTSNVLRSSIPSRNDIVRAVGASGTCLSARFAATTAAPQQPSGVAQTQPSLLRKISLQ